MASRDPNRPNVVVIVSDDQGPWALGCAGNPEIATPNLDALAAGGTRLENFFCTSPVCSPARASLFTGRMPSAHGVHDAIHRGEVRPESIEYLAGWTGYTDVLADRGYTCGLSGKWHLGASHLPQLGITSWSVWEGRGSNYIDPSMMVGGSFVQVPVYSSDIFAALAVDFVDSTTSEDKPFALNLCFTAPHTPLVGVHPAEWLDYYRDCDFRSCPAEEPHQWTRPRDQNWPDYNNAFDNPRESLTGYFAAVSAMDAAIGRFMRRLDELGLTRSTLIVFLSDNGFHAGHHGIWGKGNGTFPQNMFENSVRVPAIAYQPGRVAQGVVRNELASGYDLRPTILDWTGISDPEAGELPGRSLAPLLRDEAGGAELVVVYDEYGPTRMVRTDRWKYVHRYPLGPHELYDLTEDPDERRNLIDDPARQGVASDLRAALTSWFIEYSLPQADGTKEAITGRGQIGLVGPAAEGRPAFLPESW